MIGTEAGANTKTQPGLRRVGGRRGSIREVRLVGLSSSAEGWVPGDRVGWWGRSYEVESAEVAGGPETRAGLDEPRAAPCYLHLHLRPSDAKAAPDGASIVPAR